MHLYTRKFICVREFEIKLNAKYLHFGSARRVARDAGMDVSVLGIISVEGVQNPHTLCSCRDNTVPCTVSLRRCTCIHPLRPTCCSGTRPSRFPVGPTDPCVSLA